MRKKSIGHVRLLAEVPSTSIEWCEVYKFQEESGRQVPRSTVFYLSRQNQFKGFLTD